MIKLMEKLDNIEDIPCEKCLVRPICSYSCSTRDIFRRTIFVIYVTIMILLTLIEIALYFISPSITSIIHAITFILLFKDEDLLNGIEDMVGLILFSILFSFQLIILALLLLTIGKPVYRKLLIPLIGKLVKER